MALSRRAFLARGAVVPLAWSLPPAFLQAEPDQPGFPGMIVRSTEPRNWEFPFSALQSSITPNEHFYIRNHFPMPAIDLNSWKLSIEGAVKQKLEFTCADLLKLPTRSLTATLECAGNGRVFLTPPANGTQWAQGAVGNAVWSGVPLGALLD